MATVAKAPARTGERAVYEAGAGRKTFLSLAFLILLPFYASLPAMLITRLLHGLWFDTIGLMIFTAIFTALMALLGVQLYHSVRSRSLDNALPENHHFGSTPWRNHGLMQAYRFGRVMITRIPRVNCRF